MIKITLLIEIAPFHHTCVSVIDGSTNGSDVKFDAMNCLFLLSFNVFWAVSVSIMVVFFVSRRFFVRFWSPFSTCILLLSICILFFDVSEMVVYVIFLFISVYVQSINQSIKHYIFHCPKNLQDYLGNKVKFLNWEDNGLLSKIWICNLQWKMLDWDSRDDIINS